LLFNRLLIRLATAAALITALLAALFWLDRPAFSAVIAVVVVLAGSEWASLCGIRSAGAWAYGLACAVIFLSLTQIAGAAPWMSALAVVFWLSVAPATLARARGSVAFWIACGVLVLAPAALALLALPPKLALLTLGLVWIADTGAYLAGTTFGRHKLAPKISPGKTWEGVAGGAVGSLIYAMICVVFSPDLGGRVEGVIWVPFAAGALALFALSVIGDLFKSVLKRQAGVKDSGKLLPGHGGVLDRIDSATATLPLALLLLMAAEAARR